MTYSFGRDLFKTMAKCQRPSHSILKTLITVLLVVVVGVRGGRIILIISPEFDLLQH